eukprot:gene354-708_t
MSISNGKLLIDSGVDADPFGLRCIQAGGSDTTSDGDDPFGLRCQSSAGDSDHVDDVVDDVDVVDFHTNQGPSDENDMKDEDGEDDAGEHWSENELLWTVIELFCVSMLATKCVMFSS